MLVTGYGYRRNKAADNHPIDRDTLFPSNHRDHSSPDKYLSRVVQILSLP